MSRFQWMLVLLVIFMGSMIGGAFVEWWLGASLVSAQKSNGVHAEEFLLLDQNGKARAGLGMDPNGEVGLVMTSRDGNRKLDLTPDGPIAIKLSDRTGRVLWSAP